MGIRWGKCSPSRESFTPESSISNGLDCVCARWCSGEFLSGKSLYVSPGDLGSLRLALFPIIG